MAIVGNVALYDAMITTVAANRVGNRPGRMEPGASADLLWLDRDPRNTPALELPALQVRATYLRGRSIYSATN